jgi:hypothetical protein
MGSIPMPQVMPHLSIAGWIAVSLAVQALRIASVGTLALAGLGAVMWIAAGG